MLNSFEPHVGHEQSTGRSIRQPEGIIPIKIGGGADRSVAFHDYGDADEGFTEVVGDLTTDSHL